MSTYLSLARFAVAALALAASAASNAAPTTYCPDSNFCTYFGENLAPSPVQTVSGDPLAARTSLLSNLTGVGTENFSNSAVAPVSELAITFAGSGAGGTDITAKIIGYGEVKETPSFNNPLGRFNTTGATTAKNSGRWWESHFDFTIHFDSAISAFGFYGTDIGDFDGQLVVALFAGENDDAPLYLTTISSNTGGSSGSALFWGFHDAAQTYRKITFGNTGESYDSFGFDDLVIGSLPTRNVPEPTTLMLTGLGLLGLAATRRKQQH